MRYLILLFVAFLMSACAEQDEVSDGLSDLTDEKVAYFKMMGEAGQGWAYRALANNARMGHGPGDARYWKAKALQSNDSNENIEYGTHLLKAARKCPVNSIERQILLDEAERRAKIAVANAHMSPWIQNTANDFVTEVRQGGNLYREIAAERKQEKEPAEVECGRLLMAK